MFGAYEAISFRVMCAKVVLPESRVDRRVAHDLRLLDGALRPR